MSQGYTKYSQAYQKAAVNTLDQRKLIVMLYDGAIKFLSQAIRKMQERDYYASHTSLLKGKSIIAELWASLNMDQGGDIAVNLQRLYSFMFNELIDGNLNKDVARVEHVVELLKELRTAWSEIETPKTPAAGKAAGTAGAAYQGPARTKPINVRG